MLELWTDSLVLVMLMQLIPDRFRASGQALLYLVMSIGAMVGFMIGNRLESRGNDAKKSRAVTKWFIDIALLIDRNN